tara:strand:+ start:29 stop:214 length:186 start_codon:yes stop_codon:yes gene_type:complete
MIRCHLGGGITQREIRHIKIIWKINHMGDTNETLKNYYEEALDMGMSKEEAEKWAWDKLYD